MVKLYGVLASFSVQIPFGSSVRPLPPHHELLREITSLPAGSKIGVEWLDAESWFEVEMDLGTKRFAHGIDEELSLLGEQREFWERTIGAIEEAGLEVVYLDDVEIWKKYNDSLVGAVLAGKSHPDVSMMGRGERERALLEYGARTYAAEVETRRVHQIERGEGLLEKIRGESVTAAICSSGFTDYWRANPEAADLEVESYGKQDADEVMVGMPTFTSNAEVDPCYAFTRTSLDRSIRIVGGRNLTDETPDYVGTWTASSLGSTPHKGYFEIFMPKDDERQGRMIDCTGDAVFEGPIDYFTKAYTIHDGNACLGDIEFETDERVKLHLREGEHFGRYHHLGSGQRDWFYMAKTDKMNPIDMGIRSKELIRLMQGGGEPSGDRPLADDDIPF